LDWSVEWKEGREDKRNSEKIGAEKRRIEGAANKR
jgi:hypothetical protein